MTGRKVVSIFNPCSQWPAGKCHVEGQHWFYFIWLLFLYYLYIYIFLLCTYCTISL